MTKKILIFIVVLLSLLLCEQIWADQVDTLRPSQDIWGCATGGDWVMVPGENECWEVILDDGGDDTYIYSITLGGDYRWNHTLTFSTPNVIDSVSLGWKVRTTATAGVPTVTIGRSNWEGDLWASCNTYGGGSRLCSLTVNSTTYVTFVKTWSVDPCDNGVWTVTKLNNANRTWWIGNTNRGTTPTGRQNRATLSYIVVYSHAPPEGGILKIVNSGIVAKICEDGIVNKIYKQCNWKER